MIDGKQIELDMKREEIERIESLSNEMDFDEIDFDTLNHTQHKRKDKKKKAKSKVKRGRIKGSTTIIDRYLVQNEKFTFTLPKYQKDKLIENAKHENRNLSNYIKNTLRNIRTVSKSIIKDDDKNENNKIVSITISVSKKELNEILEFSKSVDRKMADAIKHVLKNPKQFDHKSKPILKKT